MFRTFKYIAVLFLVIQFSSCGFGFLVGKNQKVTIDKDSATTILVNNKVPVLKNDKYIFERKGEPVQITINRKGYKTANKVLIPYKLNAVGYGTVAFNSILLGVPTTTIILGAYVVSDGSLIGPAIGSLAYLWEYAYVSGIIYSNSDYWNYDKLNLLNETMSRVPVKDSLSKEIMLRNISMDVKPEKNEEYKISYENYKKGNFTKNTKNTQKEDRTRINETLLSEEINTVLKKSGYIDTSDMVLRNRYNKNNYLDASIIGINIAKVPFHINDETNLTQTTGFIRAELEIKWDVLDYYKTKLYSDTIKGISGEYISYKESANSSYINQAIKDAVHTSLYTLLNSEKLKKTIHIDANEKVDTLVNIDIRASTNYVSSIDQAVKSTVTIKCKDGHGSGFFISEDGYIITNYHVITDTTKLEIIMNDGTKYKPMVVRSNKNSDLALLKIEKNVIVPFKLTDNESYRMGQEIYAIGTPSAEDLSQTLTKGIISSIRKKPGAAKIIQTDAKVNGGNSGGPMINKDGNLIGVVNSKLIGIGVEGIGFAIPANQIQSSLSIKIK